MKRIFKFFLALFLACFREAVTEAVSYVITDGIYGEKKQKNGYNTYRGSIGRRARYPYWSDFKEKEENKLTVSEQRIAADKAKLQARAQLIVAVKKAKKAGLSAVQIAEVFDMPESSIRHIINQEDK